MIIVPVPPVRGDGLQPSWSDPQGWLCGSCGKSGTGCQAARVIPLTPQRPEQAAGRARVELLYFQADNWRIPAARSPRFKIIHSFIRRLLSHELHEKCIYQRILQKLESNECRIDRCRWTPENGSNICRFSQYRMLSSSFWFLVFVLKHVSCVSK